MKRDVARKLASCTKLIRLKRAHKPDGDIFTLCYVALSPNYKEVDEGDVMVRICKTVDDVLADTDSQWVNINNIMVYRPAVWARMLEVQKEAKRLNSEIVRLLDGEEEAAQHPASSPVVIPRGKRFF